jgi:hypothetical protein
MEAAPSRTALLAALARGRLRPEEEPPWVLDDPFALILIGESWRQIEELADSLFPREVQRDVLAGIATRSR